MKGTFGFPGVIGGITGYVRHSLSRNCSPLCRASDRVEVTAWLTAILLTLFVVPLAALHLGLQVYAAGVQAERGQAADRRPATATLLEDAPAIRALGQDHLTASRQTARARWTAQDGTVREGELNVPPGGEAGAQIGIWLDRTGRPTTPPQTHAQTLTNSIVTGLGVLLGAALVLLLLLLVLRLGLDRRRLARWEIEWELFGQQWSGRS